MQNKRKQGNKANKLKYTYLALMSNFIIFIHFLYYCVIRISCVDFVVWFLWSGTRTHIHTHTHNKRWWRNMNEWFNGRRQEASDGTCPQANEYSMAMWCDVYTLFRQVSISVRFLFQLGFHLRGFCSRTLSDEFPIQFRSNFWYFGTAAFGFGGGRSRGSRELKARPLIYRSYTVCNAILYSILLDCWFDWLIDWLVGGLVVCT